MFQVTRNRQTHELEEDNTILRRLTDSASGAITGRSNYTLPFLG